MPGIDGASVGADVGVTVVGREVASVTESGVGEDEAELHPNKKSTNKSNPRFVFAALRSARMFKE